MACEQEEGREEDGEEVVRRNREWLSEGFFAVADDDEGSHIP